MIIQHCNGLESSIGVVLKGYIRLVRLTMNLNDPYGMAWASIFDNTVNTNAYRETSQYGK